MSQNEAISAALLDNITLGPVSPRYNLGVDDWIDYDLHSSPAYPFEQTTRKRSTNEPSPQPCKKPALEPLPSNSARYAKASQHEIELLAKPYTPKKTESSTEWSVRTFKHWVTEHNNNEKENKIPEDILEKMEHKTLKKWLAVFLVEVRKVSGQPYPPTTLNNILAGVLRYMRSINPEKCPNFFSKENIAFVNFRNTMDSVFRNLRKDGVGAKKKHAKPFSKIEENELWESGVLGTDNPVSLQRAVFYYNGKNFCLRGGSEHRDLKISQLKRDSTGYTYTENASKNRHGGIAQLRLDNKSVFIAAVEEAGERCHCSLLDKYISKLPKDVITMDLLYVRPLKIFNSEKWYFSVPIGRNKLYQMVKDMCLDGGIEPRTNHSLRATMISPMIITKTIINIIIARSNL